MLFDNSRFIDWAVWRQAATFTLDFIKGGLMSEMTIINDTEFVFVV